MADIPTHLLGVHRIPCMPPDLCQNSSLGKPRKKMGRLVDENKQDHLNYIVDILTYHKICSYCAIDFLIQKREFWTLKISVITSYSNYLKHSFEM